MDYREESIECVKGNVLQMHKQIYAKYNGDFDRIYTEAYNNASYMSRVIEPGKEYELSYMEPFHFSFFTFQFIYSLAA